MTTKLIKLTPLGEFFFGGDVTFGEANQRSYYVKSRRFPQQTTLLGMLRYELLKKNNLLSNKTKDATDLVGATSFDGATDNKFGIIEALSPVFLMQNENAYFVKAKHHLDKKEDEEQKFDFVTFAYQNLLKGSPDTGGGHILMMKKNGETDFKAYDGKADFEEKLVSKTDEYPLDWDKDKPKAEKKGVFSSFDKTGNAKNYGGESDDKALFKQQFYRLTEGWSFAFLVAFEDKEKSKWNLENSIVHLGAENRPFRMEILENPFDGVQFKKNLGFEGFENLYPEDASLKTEGGLIFLSDAYCDSEIYDGTSFGKTELVTFQNINASLKDPNEGWDSKKSKTSRLNLVERGSVLVGKDTPPVSDAFKRIGYNYFKTISKKSK